ncbi:hypothetical protein HMPREF1141_3109 [Clostridium sp. MSTE9]|nr:hypothetical protein HMPREF1141_3109 [Clostridium sp. MSTE9]
MFCYYNRITRTNLQFIYKKLFSALYHHASMLSQASKAPLSLTP